VRWARVTVADDERPAAMGSARPAPRSPILRVLRFSALVLLRRRGTRSGLHVIVAVLITTNISSFA
jgi:hypothetical protein